MSTWPAWVADRSSELVSSHRVQLVLTATLCCAVGVSATIGFQGARRAYDVHDLKDSIPGLDQPHDVELVCYMHPPLRTSLTDDSLRLMTSAVAR